MGLNDAQHEARRNLRVGRVTLTGSETSTDLTAIAKSGAAPFRVAVVATVADAQVGFDAGGDYAEVEQNGFLDLGAVMPGDGHTTLYHLGNTAELSILVWS
jgi:hypothetical protein